MALTTRGRERQQVDAALARATDHLLGLQSPHGWWSAEVETSSATDAEDLLVREFLGIANAEVTQASARRIRSCQRADGTWSAYFEGTPHLSVTVEAYLALRLAGDAADAPHMAKAAAYVRAAGGIEATRVFTKIWLAIFALWSWDDVPVIAPEVIYLPAWFPLNIYDWASWTRSMMVPLAIVGSLRPRRALPFELTELRSGRPRPRNHSLLSWEMVFETADRVLHRYERRPVARLRAASLRRAGDWVLARQERDGTWGGGTTPTVFALIALHLLGYGLEHSAIERGIQGMDAFAVWEHTADGPCRRVDITQSPHWDTVLATVALADAGMQADHPALTRAAEWVLANEVRAPADWRVRRPRGETGAWPFEFHNDAYPDTDDTAAAVLALRRVRLERGQERVDQAVGRAVAWLTTMQSRDGGWGAFDADNTRALCCRVPFCDFGLPIDPPSADVTAHVIEALCREGEAQSPVVRSGVAWLLRTQEADGSWFGRWGVNHVYGTGLVLQGLVAAGIDPDSSPIRRAVAWFEQHQGEDGGWGEDPRSYVDRGQIGRGTSTASQTAWALLGLMAASVRSPAVDRGIDWLVERQRPDGNWDEPQFTGTMFPGEMYLSYHLYRLIFPITALARHLREGS
ncbi:MAG TPA: squalene--hopene cyclase [Solirubrobacteraceae bacterium]|jgi:squalene-hopene/tetraprenyl-beta-curcumene cyclase|nr:squalene--hopene cyclase [Solirubrobacteraceae bacterium]